MILNQSEVKTYNIEPELTPCDAGDPIVSTTHGQVLGKLRETVYGDHYYCFDGIPYAKPPLGKLRFRSPEPVEPWSGVRDCTEVAPKCIQYNKYTDCIEGSEDCLYLNIYAKKLESEKPLPVMVYIHGGAFATGTPSRLMWGPDYFMMKDVILVTMGYRVGALGFLNFPEPELQVSGNAGLKDVVMSLKWLKQNYHNFNGDPENITLAGNSSGSVMAHVLSMSPQCEGLFHKTFFSSGVLLGTHRICNLTYRFAKQVGYVGPENNENILNYFLLLEAEKLCDFKLLTQEEKDQGRDILFLPSVESPNVSDAIMTKEPLDMMANAKAWSHSIPMLLGTCALESLSRYYFFTKNPQLYDILKVRPDYLLTLEVKANCDLEKQQQLIKKLIKLHLGDKELCVKNVFEILHLVSTSFIYHQIHRFLSSRLRHAKAPTYLYRFDFDTPDFNLYRMKYFGNEIRGVTHSDDLSFIFYMLMSFKLPKDSENFKMIIHMMNLITAFMSNSNPNYDSFKPVFWKPVSPTETYKCLNISNESTFIDWPESENCKMWDQYYKEAGIRLF